MNDCWFRMNGEPALVLLVTSAYVEALSPFHAGYIPPGTDSHRCAKYVEITLCEFRESVKLRMKSVMPINHTWLQDPRSSIRDAVIANGAAYGRVMRR
jgi:hypothetical protein